MCFGEVSNSLSLRHRYSVHRDYVCDLAVIEGYEEVTILSASSDKTVKISKHATGRLA